MTMADIIWAVLGALVLYAMSRLQTKDSSTPRIFRDPLANKVHYLILVVGISVTKGRLCKTVFIYMYIRRDIWQINWEPPV